MQSSGWGSMLPLQGAWAQFLVRELRPLTCCVAQQKKETSPPPPPQSCPLSFSGIGLRCGPGIHKLKCPWGFYYMPTAKNHSLETGQWWPCCKPFLTRSKCESLWLCPTLFDPMDCSPPGSPVHGILQARTLECVAIPFSRGSSLPRD